MGTKNWSPEEVTFLKMRWGTTSVERIAEKLNRTTNAVILKARRLNLGASKHHYDGVTIHELSKILGIDYKTILNLIERYDLPAKKKLFSQERKILVVKYKDFWKWCKDHKHMIDFSKMDPLSLGKEPSWVKEKRNADQRRFLKIKKSHSTVWTEEDDNILKGMLSAHLYTYPEIADRLKRSQGAVKARIKNLGLKSRPLRFDPALQYPNHLFPSDFVKKRWTEEEDQELIRLATGYQYTVFEAAVELKRTVAAVKDRICHYDIVENAEFKATDRFCKHHQELKKKLVPKQVRKAWSKEEDQLVITMCQEGYTIIEIANKLGRNLSSVKNRLGKLKVRARPLDEYTPEQVDLIVDLIHKGYCLEDIAERIGKSALGVRGKLERMGYKFKKGVPMI